MKNINGDTTKSLSKTFSVFFAILRAIIIPVCIYTERSFVAKIMTFISLYSIWTVLISLVIPILFCIVVATIYTLGWRFGWLKPGYVKVPQLLLAVLCASYIAYTAPVVFTPEQLYFEQHESEFAHQVELIKQGGSIDHFGNLKVYIPDESQAIIFGYWSDDFNLSSYAYVYAEKYSDLDSDGMCSKSSYRYGNGGYVYAPLSTNWYLCYRTDDWD